MIKKLTLIALGIALAVAIVYVALSVYSRRAPQLGTIDGRLRPCPNTPNCVCSDTADAGVAPLRFAGNAEAAWTQLADVLAAAGGHIVLQTPDYLHATFESRWMRFVDDLEARLDTQAGVIHVRSSSRVGYSDRGVNAARIERLRESLLISN